MASSYELFSPSLYIYIINGNESFYKMGKEGKKISFLMLVIQKKKIWSLEIINSFNLLKKILLRVPAIFKWLII